MREPEFDYSKCSLAELHDVARHIDKDQFPERYAMVLREIKNRKSSSLSTVELVPTKKTPQERLSFFSALTDSSEHGGWIGLGIGLVLGLVLLVLIFSSKDFEGDHAIGIIYLPIPLALFGFVAGAVIGAIAGMCRWLKDR